MLTESGFRNRTPPNLQCYTGSVRTKPFDFSNRWRQRKLAPRNPSALITWRRQPKQLRFLDACGYLDVLDGGKSKPPIAPLIGFGGAAGSGKTDALLVLGYLVGCAFPGANVTIFRRTYAQLSGPDGAIPRSRELFARTGGVYNEGAHQWRFPWGSSVYFRYCDRTADVFNYYSQQFPVLALDEATQFDWFTVNYLLTRNRSRFPGLIPFCVMPTNPGGIGHGWYKQIFLPNQDPEQVHELTSPSGETERTYFIPALLDDNPALTEADPEYGARLERRGGTIARQLRWGDWDTLAGLFFSEHWRGVAIGGLPPHVIPTREVDKTWTLYGSVDYGFNARTDWEKPFVYGLYGVAHDGHVYRIDELAAAHWDVSKQKEEISRLEARYQQEVSYRVGCPSMWTRQKEYGPTISEEYSDLAIAGVRLPVIPPNSDRISGSERCRHYLNLAPDGLPWFMSFDRCSHFNNQVASVPQDPRHPDDIDPDAEDHAVEEWRHFLMSRPAPPALVILAEPPPRSPAAVREYARQAGPPKETEEYV